ncbi:hypothetical protein CIB48_g1879 [Xylaria polymorpha]|nr:hypothetical protein CIB48_g1879 [Xylaria polymorpha]
MLGETVMCNVDDHAWPRRSSWPQDGLTAAAEMILCMDDACMTPNITARLGDIGALGQTAGQHAPGIGR